MIHVFYHLRKTGGTSVRSAFSGYRKVPYCLTEAAAIRLIRRWRDENATAPIFWENHCHPRMQRAPETLRTLRSIAPVRAFTILRHPVAHVPSEYFYFHQRHLSFYDFVTLNPDLMLFGTRTCDKFPFLGFDNPGGGCDLMVERALALLRHFDAVAKLENATAALPPGLRMRHANRGRKRPVDAELVRRHNRCSIRLYEAVRSNLSYGATRQSHGSQASVQSSGAQKV